MGFVQYFYFHFAGDSFVVKPSSGHNSRNNGDSCCPEIAGNKYTLRHFHGLYDMQLGNESGTHWLTLKVFRELSLINSIMKQEARFNRSSEHN